MSAERYGRVAMTLHWAIGALLLGQIAFGFLLDEIAPRNTPARAGVINLHKSFGVVLGLLILARFAWRLWHKPPAWARSMSMAEQRAARLGHRVLYACMIVMPLSGYVASNFSKYGVKFFGIAMKPWGPESAQAYSFFNWIHVGTAFVLSALIVGHILIAFKHLLIDHDGVVQRMWPGRDRNALTSSSIAAWRR
ncbi:MAG: cytochrome b [Caldimonas sp.]